MIKVLILSLFTFVAVSLTSGSLLARNLFITHGQFLQLSESDKKAYVVSIMEFVVELESQYKRDLQSKNRDSEKLRKTSQLLHTLQSFFMGEAHAAPAIGWDDFASKFLSTLSRARNNSICIYAGWPSSMQNNLCRHPSATSQMSNYQRQGCALNQVSCNPVIFGYKKESSKSLFCAPTNDSSKNSALECMRQALKDPQDPEADSKTARLDYLKKKLEANSAIINQIYKFTAQACLCETGPVALDSSYGDRIRPHRTCYGLMNMMANVAPLCSQASLSGMNTNIFTELKNKIQLDFGANPGSFDDLYKSYLTDLRRDHASDVRAMCPNDNIAVGDTRTEPPDTSGAVQPCKATCSPAVAATATTPATARTCTSFKRGEETLTTEGTPVFGTGDKANTVTIKLTRPSAVAPAASGPNDSASATLNVECSIEPDSTSTPTPTPTPTSTTEPAKVKLTIKTSHKVDSQDSERIKLKAEVLPEAAKDADVKWYRKSTMTSATTSGTVTTGTATTGTATTGTATTGTATTGTATTGTATTGTATTGTATTGTATTDDNTPVTASSIGGTTTTVASTATSRGPIVESGADTTHPKETTTTELCAVATKTGYEDSDPSCETIEAKDPAAAAKANPTGSGFANPMAPPMGGGLNSTINGGIR